MKRSTKIILAVLFLGSLSAGAYLYSSKHKAEPEAPKFRTATVDKGAITQVILSSGTLQPVLTVNIGTQVSGTVTERLVDFNDRVKKGQILLKIDPALIQAKIRQANAQLKAAQASLALASANHERNMRLQASGFISGAALEQTKRELDVGNSNVEVAKATLETANTDLNNSIVRSPIDGVVIKRNTDVGQTVAASFQTPDLFQIAQDLKDMVIYSNVSEADVGLIREGQKVNFIVDAYPGRDFDGLVKQFRLSPNSASGVVTYNIVISVANTEELLKPGMTAQTRIVVANKPDVVRIPTAALRFKPAEDTKAKKAKNASEAKATPETKKASDGNDDDNKTKDGVKIFRVYIIGKDNTPLQKDITIGISNTKFTEMLTGEIKAGDELITRSLAINPLGPD
jgi:HlyD family secretion protein